MNNNCARQQLQMEIIYVQLHARVSPLLLHTVFESDTEDRRLRSAYHTTRCDGVIVTGGIVAGVAVVAGISRKRLPTLRITLRSC